MDWEGRQDWQALKRIVALLLAFAALADLAGSKPRPLRAAALWFLRPAEAIARDFVCTIEEDCAGRIGRPAQPWFLDDPYCCTRLAHSFRALAGLLTELIGCGSTPLPSGRLSRQAIRDWMLNLRNLFAGHPALARSALGPSFLDSS